ncbi:ricin-type beta-trefoil lectin domain protein [Streptomyces sp. NPDC056716]|uniref:ricin-type beta-trefoil lectin domain protein n=1 Tax=unclassified Streptomyces TaxID=2593676 RepID=UPI00368F1B5F
MARARSVPLAAAVAATALTLAAGLLTASPARAATGAITGLAGTCLDVAGANSADGTPVQLYDCDGTAAQRWTTGTDGTVRALGKCLDVTGNNPASGTRAQLWSCTGAAHQKWTAPAPGDPGTSAPMAVAPYLYNGWGGPPSPTTITAATGVKWFTPAFVLSNGYCDPRWDGSRALTSGVDQQTIATVRANGGDVIPSFGGWSGNKLESSCATASEPAAYQRVISAYGLAAIDIEAAAYDSPDVQQRTVDALKTVKAANPGLKVYVTIGTGQSGPDTGLINRAASSGLTVDGWTIMPFNFGGAGQNMGELSVQAAEGLKNALKAAYGYSDDQAYRSMGISSMNGITDQNETVTVADFRTMLAHAQQHHLARLTFWSANRDRPCTGGPADSCSGVGQSDWDYTRVFAAYTG